MTVRGGVYAVAPTGRTFLVLSPPYLNDNGVAVVVEIAGAAFGGARNMLSVPMGDTDPLPGAQALAWRINWVRTDRLGEFVGQVHPDTLDQVVATVKAVIEP